MRESRCTIADTASTTPTRSARCRATGGSPSRQELRADRVGPGRRPRRRDARPPARVAATDDAARAALTEMDGGIPALREAAAVSRRRTPRRPTGSRPLRSGLLRLLPRAAGIGVDGCRGPDGGTIAVRYEVDGHGTIVLDPWPLEGARSRSSSAMPLTSTRACSIPSSRRSGSSRHEGADPPRRPATCGSRMSRSRRPPKETCCSRSRSRSQTAPT